MEPLAPDRSENVFPDKKPPYSEAQALVEANRCLYCFDAPCVKACPTSIDIPEFIRKIATGNIKGSARTIFESNILGASCARVCPVEVLCVGDCVHDLQGVPPIQIGRLQRYATDRAVAEGWQFFEAGADTGKSVGLVGGGPASLACAHELRRLGHAVTIYEQHDYLGGLNTDGVAPYKLKADDARKEIDWLLGIGGIELELGTTIGADVDFDELLDEHDAVFVGLGLGPDRRLDVPGSDLAGVEGAVAYIARMKLEQLPITAKHAIVVGGGNTAIDCVRELLGLGIPEVTMIYRGTEASMSGYAHEWAAAKKEGGRALWQALPVSYEGVQGQIVSVRCTRLDDKKKAIAGSEIVLSAQLVLEGVGQSKIGQLLAVVDGVVLDDGRVVTDNDGRTGHPKVWAGGDCRNGGKEVVNAVAEGRDAARSIDQALRGGTHA